MGTLVYCKVNRTLVEMGWGGQVMLAWVEMGWGGQVMLAWVEMGWGGQVMLAWAEISHCIGERG